MDTLISDFQTPGLWRDKFLLLCHLGLCYFVMEGALTSWDRVRLACHYTQAYFMVFSFALLHFTELCIHKCKFCGNPVSSTSAGAIFFLTAFGHFMSPCHILAILTISNVSITLNVWIVRSHDTNGMDEELLLTDEQRRFLRWKLLPGRCYKGWGLRTLCKFGG